MVPIRTLLYFKPESGMHVIEMITQSPFTFPSLSTFLLAISATITAAATANSSAKLSTLF